MEPDMVQPEVEDDHSLRHELVKRKITEIIHSRPHRTIRDITNELQSTDKSISLVEIQEAFTSLQQDGIVRLYDPIELHSFGKYVRHHTSFWIVCLIMAATLALVYFAPSDKLWVAVRICLGTVFVLLVPGYALVNLLMGRTRINHLERLVLSIAASLAVISIIGLVLNSGPWGLGLNVIVLSITCLSLIFMLLASYRSFLSSKSSQEKTEKLSL
jgi:uncharacterized membrane protein